MKRILSILSAVAIVAAVSAPVFAQTSIGGQPQSMPPGAAINFHVDATVDPVTGETIINGSVVENRTQKAISYSNFNAVFNASYFYSPPPGLAIADDIEKEPGSKDLLNRFEIYVFMYGNQTDTVKLDIYDATDPIYGNTILPSAGNLLATAIIPLNSAGLPYLFGIITVDVDPAIMKSDRLWAVFQNSTGQSGPIIAEGPDQPAIGRGFNLDLGYGPLFAIGDKATDTWVNGYVFNLPPAQGGQAGDFIWQIWNSPEPTTMLLVAGGAVALLRRRR